MGNVQANGRVVEADQRGVEVDKGVLGGTRDVRADGGCCGEWGRGGETSLYKRKNPSLSSLF